ncbi:MAG TPA: ABC transporter permease [Candidatus Bipolaricaulis anaerobius]|nr:ABC transporter permease [Candidatus Bipolaricaulis anaerobius]HNS23704.1 ABC transporter permease [Candidatus Bipolaricaulis anaerobius]
MGQLLKFIFKRKTGAVGFCLLCTILLLAILAPFVSPYNPQLVTPAARLQSPNFSHWFGTDHFGRDIFSRVLYGAQLSLIVGLSVAVLSLIMGVALGASSAYFTTFGLVVMRLVDALMAFPEIMLALALMAIVGQASLINVIIALGVVYAPRMARTAYSLSLRIREFAYIEAAQAIGTTHWRILVRHIIPNLVSPIIVQSTFTCALAVLGAASLDFLGVGVPPYVPSWGTMVSEGRLYITRAPWITIFPGIFILLLVMSLNLLGDSLRDALDPRLRKLL